MGVLEEWTYLQSIIRMLLMKRSFNAERSCSIRGTDLWGEKGGMKPVTAFSDNDGEQGTEHQSIRWNMSCQPTLKQTLLAQASVEHLVRS